MIRKHLAVHIAIFCPPTLSCLVLLLFGGSFLFIGRGALIGLICIVLSICYLSSADEEDEIKERLAEYKRI